MPFSDEFLAMWEHIIDEVHKTEIPLECIKKVVIKLHGKKQKTINLQTLRRQGLDSDELETVLSRALHELGDQVRDIEFMVDVNAVAEIVQPETDKLLNNLR
jgi:acid phosphatase class B